MDASTDGSELFGLSLGVGAFEELVAAGYGDIQGSTNTTAYRNRPPDSSAAISASAASDVHNHHPSSGNVTPGGGSHTPLDDARALSRVSSHTELADLQELQFRRTNEQVQQQQNRSGHVNGHINEHGQEHGHRQLSVNDMFGREGQKGNTGHGHDGMDQQQQQQQQSQQQQNAAQSQAQANQMNLEALQQLQLLAMQNLPLLSTDNNSQQQQQQTQQQQQQQSTLQLGSLPNLSNLANLPMPPSGSASLLEQQIRLNQLQQLQQLQAQIFQQQIELISGQTGLSNGLDSTSQNQGQLFREFQGLPTPASSAELRAQPSSTFVSPMILQNFMAQPPSNTPLQQFSSPNPLPQGTSSAPAHLAFHTTHPALPSPADVGSYDFSPITSPWLEPYQQPDHAHTQLSQQHQGQQQQQQQQPPPKHQSLNLPAGASAGLSTPRSVRATRSSTKRGASSSGDDTSAEAQVRKRALPSVRAAAANGGGGGGAGGGVGQRTRPGRGTASLTSTPAMRGRSRKNSNAGGMVEDTPSPVDLSMPPPAPPMQGTGESAGEQQHQSQQGQHGHGQMSPTSPATIAPVTPAAIMGLGRLGLSSGLAPLDGGEAGKGGAQGKRKTPPKGSQQGNSAGPSSSRTAATKRVPSASTLVGQSPSLKPLLPGGGLPPSSVQQLAAASNYTHHLSGSASSLNLTPSAPLPQPVLQVRKTSHKAAEQKRRDSLKTSFDDLRLLLPPLPLPNDENYDRDPPLPGELPPRGPPRGEAQGPNRAVSKLQLLRCGNDFIRRLKARVVRRDEYIESLKQEVRTLRAIVEAKGESEGVMEEADVDGLEGAFQRVDLDKDLDAEEANAPKLGGNVPLEGDEADEEGGE